MLYIKQQLICTHSNKIYLTYNYSGKLVFIAVELIFATYHLYVSPNVSTVQCGAPPGVK